MAIVPTLSGQQHQRAAAITVSIWLDRLPVATIKRIVSEIPGAAEQPSHDTGRWRYDFPRWPGKPAVWCTGAEIVIAGGDPESNRRLAVAIHTGCQKALRAAKPAASAACAAFRVFVDFCETMAPLSAQELQEATSPTAQAYRAALRAVAEHSACLSPDAEFLLLKAVHRRSPALAAQLAGLIHVYRLGRQQAERQP
ncbi:MAG: hypothetical protein KatS3mg057_2685 [Herpetosiphonaceae bacterium]|nr:MAG: hypothetical protein KatS3mg057_2685 [Herpetosiphonaceae bacterium]